LEEPYINDKNTETRWASFENIRGEKGRGGMQNAGAKGSAFRHIEAGASVTLMETESSGVVDRIWLSLQDRSPENLRSLRIDMYWDDAEKPAVSAPLGDFFGANLGLPVRFESCLLSNPEGRSFNSFFKMPFFRGAKIVLTNESEKRSERFFYYVYYSLKPLDPEKALYFHTHWRRENPTTIGRDYTILPKLEGEGKFIGLSAGVRVNKGYEDSWFGEGEMKFYLDGDTAWPTLCGTGTEDYLGTAWGQGEFYNSTSGSLISNMEKGLFSFYCFHVKDSVYFHKDIRVTLQVMGGAEKYKLLKLIDKGLPVKIVSRDGKDFSQLYEKEFSLERDSEEGWYNYYREDDFSSAAYFYYNSPVNGLPPLPPLKARTADLENIGLC
jgi:hypothetical protein